MLGNRPIPFVQEMCTSKKHLFIHRLIVALIFLNLIVNAVFAARYTVLDSDHVANFLFLAELFKTMVFLPPDNFFLHYPISYAVINFFGFTSFAAAINIFVLVSVTLSIYSVMYIFIVQQYFAKKSTFYLFPLFFFINISWLFYNFIAHPFLRNIEFAFVFSIVLYFDHLKTISKKRLLKIGIYLLLLGVLLSDPYFLYLFALPLLATFVFKGVGQKIWRKEIFFLLVVLVLRVVLLNKLNSSSYFIVVSDYPQFISVGKFLQNAKFTMSGISQILDLQNFASPISWGIMILFFASVAGLFLGIKKYLKREVASPILFSLIFFATIGAYLFSTRADAISGRYLIFIIFLLPFGISFFLSGISPYLRNGVIFLIVIISVSHFLMINSTYY